MMQAGKAPWVEVEVGSWAELIAQLHDPAMIRADFSSGGHRRSHFVFRGMGNAAWSLQTSLQRNVGPAGDPTRVEVPSLRAFRKFAPVGTLLRSSTWEALAVAQHNGLPTRFLDWTNSPMVAAHFATWRKKEWDLDGVIWCVDATALRESLPSKFRAILDEHKAWIFDCRMLDASFPELRAFDTSVPEDVLVFLEPPSIDARIANQSAVLSMMNGADRDHGAFLWSLATQYPGSVRRIIIKHTAKPEIRDLLDQNNVTERMLFPGLPGLCEWLTRYYSPA